MISYQRNSGLRYLSVCDGIGAVHLAWQRLGWECVGTSEIDDFPNAVVEHHFGFRNLCDMTRFHEWPERLLADVDVLVGGTPCQAFSVAGLRQSLDDERGKLTRVYVELFNHINKVRKNHGRAPTIALWENVQGALTTPDNAFGCLVGGLLGCDEAPQTEDGKWHNAGLLGSQTVRVGWRVLDARFFALAQRRRRVFLVAVPCELVECFGPRACPSEILSIPESVRRDPPSRGALRQEAAGSASGSLACDGTGGHSDHECIAFHQNAQGCQLPSITRDTRIADCLTASQRAAVAFTKSKRARSGTDNETWVPGEVSPTLTCFDQGNTRATTVVTVAGLKQNSCDVSAVEGRNQPINEVCHTLLASQSSGDALVGSSEFAGTLTASRGSSFRSTGTPIEGVAIHGQRVRRLTPRECERLQGFPDDFTLVPFRGKPAADTPRYKALGNSIAVPILSWIGHRITQAFVVD
jgi:DNA (cytosine-5)-methyltransferase 1